MASLNLAQVIGHVGKDPEVRSTESGRKVANFTMATKEVWTDREGGKREDTQWHRIVCWGKLAEVVGEYVTKGRLVYVQGKLQTREWEKDGVKRYTTEINAFNVQFLGESKGSSGSRGEEDEGGGRQEETHTGPRSGSQRGNANDDDLPY